MRRLRQDADWLVSVALVVSAAVAATSLGLGACGVGAFADDDINDMLGVDGTEEAAVYMVAVGRRG